MPVTPGSKMACFACCGDFKQQKHGYQRKPLGSNINSESTVAQGLETLLNTKLDVDKKEFVCLPCFRAVSKAVNKEIEARAAENDVHKMI